MKALTSRSATDTSDGRAVTVVERLELAGARGDVCLLRAGSSADCAVGRAARGDDGATVRVTGAIGLAAIRVSLLLGAPPLTCRVLLAFAIASRSPIVICCYLALHRTTFEAHGATEIVLVPPELMIWTWIVSCAVAVHAPTS